ncbi:MAG: phosphoenolpyruvate synthase, partial [Candidatus Uhrbacteria bacterium]|nr:phosphoenolpyruvate synthase [Candidatus Uhrbacteria bacterium]
MEWITPFSAVNSHDVARAGGKGALLGQMTQAGISVPPGFVVLAGAPEHIDEELVRAFDDLGVARVAVRSSATVEDGLTASWAGQFETYLNVKRDELIDAVRKCRASVQNVRVEAYCVEQGIEA